jgi:hypothetical protein
MSYLVVTTLDLADIDRVPVERELAALGLLSCLVDSRNEAHVLPRNTYAGVFEGPTAHALHRRLASEIRAAVGRSQSEARVFVSVGGDWSLRHAA